jgi:hypothetical protein
MAQQANIWVYALGLVINAAAALVLCANVHTAALQLLRIKLASWDSC